MVALFEELEECRAFELLRSSYDRGNYLLTKHAKAVAVAGRATLGCSLG